MKAKTFSIGTRIVFSTSIDELRFTSDSLKTADRSKSVIS